MPAGMAHAFFIAGGGLAIENALKTAMDYKVQKNFKKGCEVEKGFKVIHFEHAFHGRTGYTMSLTNSAPVKTKWYAKFDWPRITTPILKFPVTEESLKEVEALEAQAIKQIKAAFTGNPDDVCAIIIEPVQAEGGDNHIRKEFFEQLRILADENDCFLIYDEVQTGVGLSGKFWCYEHFGEKAKPDILVFGKKMQVCGLVANSKVDEIDNNVFNVSSRLNSTWGGSLVDMVRATKILEVIQQDSLVENAAQAGTYLQEKLKKIADGNEKISNVRGKGLLTAFDFPSRQMRDSFIKKGLEHGAIFLGCGEVAIRFRPALIIENPHIEEGIDIIERVLPSL
jgi:L-lysine 6-transaminase